MAKCLRCGAGNEWIEGNVRASQSDQAEVLSQQLTEVQYALECSVNGNAANNDRIDDLERQLTEVKAERDAAYRRGWEAGRDQAATLAHEKAEEIGNMLLDCGCYGRVEELTESLRALPYPKIGDA